MISKTIMNALAVMFSFIPPCTASDGITSVLSATGALPIIAPNTWIVIRGNGIVPATAPPDGVVWSSAPEFAQGRMPTEIGGVSVTVNDRPAFIYFYCSAATIKVCTQDQINVLTPLNFATGPVEVRVTSRSGRFSLTVTMQSLSPGFFQFPGTPNVLAVHADGRCVGPQSLFPCLSSPAEPNERIILYGNGFGDVVPPLTNGSATQNGTLPELPQIQIGGIPVTTQFAGLISPGVFQFNVLVPATAPSGYLAVGALYRGTITQSGIVVLVQP